MKKLLSILLASVLVVGIMVGCSQEETKTDSSTSKSEVANETESKPIKGKYEIKVGYGTNPGHPIDLAAVKFEEDAEKKAKELGYDLDVQLFPSAQLGSEKEMVEQLQMGTIDMVPTTTGPLGLFEPKFLVFDLPYVFMNEEHADTVLDGEIGTEILNSLEDKGIIGLAWWENGFRELTNNKLEIKSPSDLKGIKLRTMQNDVHIDYFSSLGASPTPLGFGEIYTSLQSGVIDGQENPFSIIATNNFYEVQPYVTKSDHVYSPVPVLYSKALFEKLPEELQNMIKDTVFELRIYQRESGRSQQQEYISTIESKATIYYLADAEKKAFQDAAQETYAKFEDVIGKDLMERVLDTWPE